jgi:hypothetical protein
MRLTINGPAGHGSMPLRAGPWRAWAKSCRTWTKYVCRCILRR